MTEERRCAECGAELPSDAPMGLCPKCVLKQGVDSLHASTASAGTGGFTPPLIADLAPHFPQLEILELLGQGGMGAVYKARQPGLDRLVALKILPTDIGRDPAFAERFKREARSLARLNHPHIVAVYDFGQAAGLYYFVMEYVDGVTLRQLERAARPKPQEALGIVIQICEALQYAHEEGIVHRDIKPENVLLDKKGRVKIADFGLAKLVAPTPQDFTLTQPEQVMGTPHYMAPEQLEHPAEVDQRADIYSLGVVLYEMLTGELPLGRFLPPSQKVLVDVRLDEVVLKTLEKEPQRRYQQASEVRTDVTSIAATPCGAAASCGTAALGGEERQPSPHTAGPPPRPRFSRAAIAGAVWAPFFLLALGVAAYSIIGFQVAVPGPVGSRAGGASWAVILIAVPLLLLGLTAPFGTTILGLVAMSQIRHSAGRLYGMGLAIADALLSPLIVLDSLLVLVSIFVCGLVWHGPVPGVAIGIFGVLVAVAADVAIVWLVHRWATRPVSGRASGGMGGLAIAAIVLVGLLVLGLLAVVPLAGYFWLSVSEDMPRDTTVRAPAVEPRSAEAPRVELRRYPLDSLDGLLTKSGVDIDLQNTADLHGSSCLKVVAAEPTTMHLFETGPLAVQNARLIYQAKMRSENLAGRAYLEMWCHFPDGGQYFSRGLATTVSGTTGWMEVQTPFMLKEGQKPDKFVMLPRKYLTLVSMQERFIGC